MEEHIKVLREMQKQTPRSWEQRYRSLMSEAELLGLYGSIDNYVDFIERFSGSKRVADRTRRDIEKIRIWREAYANKMDKKKTVGRPIKGITEKLSYQIGIKLKPRQYKYIKEVSKNAGVKPNVFIREFLFPPSL